MALVSNLYISTHFPLPFIWSNHVFICSTIFWKSYQFDCRSTQSFVFHHAPQWSFHSSCAHRCGLVAQNQASKRQCWYSLWGVGDFSIWSSYWYVLATESGQVLRSEGTQVECINVGSEFDLQAIVDLEMVVGVSEVESICWYWFTIVGSSNRKLLLVGRSTAKIVGIRLGLFTEVATLDPTHGFGGEITSWDAETVFSTDGDTHHCAFDWIRGLYPSITQRMTAIFFNSWRWCLNLVPLQIIKGYMVSFHKHFICQRTNRYGSTKRYLVTTSADMKSFKFLVRGAIPSDAHTKQIVPLFLGPCWMATEYRPRSLVDLYIESGRNRRSLVEWIHHEPQSSYKPKWRWKQVVSWCWLWNTDQVYSKNEFLGQSIATPHLVVTRWWVYPIYSVGDVDKGDTLTDDLRDNENERCRPWIWLVGDNMYWRWHSIKRTRTFVGQFWTV